MDAQSEFIWYFSLVSRPPSFLFFGCVQYNTRKQGKHGNKAGICQYVPNMLKCLLTNKCGKVALYYPYPSIVPKPLPDFSWEWPGNEATFTPYSGSDSIFTYVMSCIPYT